MGVYAVLEYLTTPGLTVWGLLVHHGWHVLALGAVFYVVGWLAISRLVVRPLNTVYLHLYATAGGQRTPLQLESKVAEIESIVEGINVMLLRLDRAEYSPSPQRLETDIALLRQEVEQMDVSVPGARAAILESLEALAVSVEETHSPVRTPVETR